MTDHWCCFTFPCLITLVFEVLFACIHVFSLASSEDSEAFLKRVYLCFFFNSTASTQQPTCEWRTAATAAKVPVEAVAIPFKLQLQMRDFVTLATFECKLFIFQLIMSLHLLFPWCCLPFYFERSPLTTVTLWGHFDAGDRREDRVGGMEPAQKETWMGQSGIMRKTKPKMKYRP